ncbi:MAG: ParA family protein [Rickettsiales bacterium]|nr:ParA family protein [Rickettsiales bacterium]
MTTVLGIVNQKGGVGKTTTAINLATGLAAIGKKVCVIDLDPQGNASTGLGIERKDRKITSYDLLIHGQDPRKALLKTSIPKLDVIPATIDLSGADLELAPMRKREFRLRMALAKLVAEGDYHTIVIDCPPSLSLLTLNALAAANKVLIPLQCEFYALEGLSHLLKTIKIVQSRYNDALKVDGVVLTMYDRRNKLTENIEQDVRAYLGSQVYETVIPRNVRVSEAPSYGMPSILYDMHCAGSQAYIALAKEMIKRNKFKKLTVKMAA